jgi:hypothetical protein
MTRRQRLLVRGVHISAAAALGFFVYAPDHIRDGALGILTAALFFPILAVSGYGMWLGPVLVRRLRRRRVHGSAASAWR